MNDMYTSLARCSSVVMEPPVYASFPLPSSHVFAAFPPLLFCCHSSASHFFCIFFQLSSPIYKFLFFNLCFLSRRLDRAVFKAFRPFRVKIRRIASWCSGGHW